MGENRINSVLTTNQREFLRMTDEEREDEYSRQARSYHRKAIRDRVQTAFHDFSLLWQHLDISERDEIFYPSSEQRLETGTDLIDTIAFLYRFLEGDIGDSRPDTWRLRFKDIVEPGIRNGEKMRHPHGHKVTVDAELVIEVETRPITIRDQAIEELAKGNIDNLSDAELRILIRNATKKTIQDDSGETLVEGEPIEEALDDYYGDDLHGLARAVEEKAKELEGESDGE